MRIAIVGKGGSGKTSISALLARYLAGAGNPVLALDADINQHLAAALAGADNQHSAPPPLGERLDLIKDWLRGSNPLIGASEEMVKTTPPGEGSRLLTLRGPNPIYDACVRNVNGVRLAVTGPFADSDVGVACYHGKVGAAELVLSHLVDGPGEYVVVDTTAGADSVASGLFARFDLVAVVVEPTLKSLSVWDQLTHHAVGFGTPLVAVANKIEDDSDLEFLHDRLADEPVAALSRSALVRAAERGRQLPIDQLEPDNLAALQAIQARLDATPRDWDTMQANAVELHKRNANAWANARTGIDLTAQIDPDFVPHPTKAA